MTLSKVIVKKITESTIFVKKKKLTSLIHVFIKELAFCTMHSDANYCFYFRVNQIPIIIIACTPNLILFAGTVF